MRIAVVVALAVLAATVVARFGTSDSNAEFLGNLNGNVGPGSEISLRLTDGTLVSSLAAGEYAIRVTDQATNHNFHLEGPGVNQATVIEDLSTVEWMVSLGDGGYTYRCDRHSNLNGGFLIGAAPAAPAPAPTPAPAPPPVYTPPPVFSSPVIELASTPTSLAGTLRVTLTAKDALVLTKSGKVVKKVPAGLYRIVVTDRSAKRDVTLRLIGGLSTSKTLTARRYVGTKTVKLDLGAGQWKVYSAANEQGVFSFFRVTN